MVPAVQTDPAVGREAETATPVQAVAAGMGREMEVAAAAVETAGGMATVKVADEMRVERPSKENVWIDIGDFFMEAISSVMLS